MSLARSMIFFSKAEQKGLLIIFVCLVTVLIPNFAVSLRRARDAQRKADIGSIYSALNNYHEDFGGFPLSIDGKIAACEPVSIKDLVIVYSSCEYGQSSLRDLSDANYPPYLKIIPNDPGFKGGFGYYYLSDGNRFQIYGALEGKNEDEYDEKIIKRGLPCGKKICNFGKAFERTPLDKSIEEYENEIQSQNAKVKS